jgi:hypothetical protein
MPIHNGMIEAEHQPLLFTGLSQLLKNIPPEWCGHHIKISLLGIPEPKPLVMFGGDNRYFMPASLAIFTHPRRRTKGLN